MQKLAMQSPHCVPPVAFAFCANTLSRKRMSEKDTSGPTANAEPSHLPVTSRTAPHQRAFSIFVSVNCPFTRSTSNFTLSPDFTAVSIDGSLTRNTMVMPWSMSNCFIGPCLMLIFSACTSIFVTVPSTFPATWASAAKGSAAASAATRMNIRCLIILTLLSLVIGRSLHDHLSDHAGLVVAGNEAGVFKLAGLGEFPEDLPAAVGRDLPAVRIVVLHIGELFHRLGMLLVLFDRGEHELVVLVVLVLQHEADLLVATHLDARRLEQHFLALRPHLHRNSARARSRISRLASREGDMEVVLVRLARPDRARSGHQRARPQKQAAKYQRSLDLQRHCGAPACSMLMAATRTRARPDDIDVGVGS